MTNAEAVNWLINITADIGKAEHSDLWHYEQALSEIREMLEDAQPEKRTEERTETHACDCISRQAAIAFVDCGYLRPPTELAWSDKDVVDMLKRVPSAQPQRWIPVTKEEMFKAGYEGREIRFRVDGRLFAIRELAQ